jgi:hypothetical protein
MLGPGYRELGGMQRFFGLARGGLAAIECLARLGAGSEQVAVPCQLGVRQSRC